MLSIFKSSHTYEDLVELLKKDRFSESKANNMLKNVNIKDVNSDSKTLLHQVAHLNRIESIHWLVNHGVDINAQDVDGSTALMLAAVSDSSKSVETLLKLKANPDIKNGLGRTAMQEALLNRKFSSFEILKRYTKDFNNVDFYDQNLIFHLVSTGHFKLLNGVLAEKKVKIKIEQNNILFFEDTYQSNDIALSILKSGISIDDLDDEGKNILFYIIRNGIENLETLKFALKKGLDINHTDSQNNNILIQLAYYIVTLDERDFEEPEDRDKMKKSLLDLIPVLIDYGVKTDISNEKNENLLTIAVQNNNLELLSNLLLHGVDPNITTKTNETALDIAAIRGSKYEEELDLLIDYGANPNIKNSEGRTLLENLIDIILFVENRKKIDVKLRQVVDENEDYTKIIEKILAKSETDLLQLNSNNEPYIFEIVKYDNISLLKLLVSYGADINQKKEDQTNIIYKYMSEKKELKSKEEQSLYNSNLKTIITLGADINCRDKFGGTTLHKAILENDEFTIKTLINAGADLNAVDNRGRNMIHNTIWKNRKKIFIQLISYNKKLINLPDKFGVLPINYAAFLGYTDLVLILINHESHMNNTNKKSQYILDFLKRFHKNLDELITTTTLPSDQQKLKQLIENMKKEFNVTS